MVEPAARTVPAVSAALWLKALAPAERFAFYGEAPARAAATPVWGAIFSEEACKANSHATRATLWVGPHEYLLLDLAPRASVPLVSPTFSALEQALVGIPHSLVDISHRQFALELSGYHATTILSGACPLDLDPAVFPVGMCTRTVLAKADIVLWRTQEHSFHLEVWRSFAGYVTGILQEVAREFYPYF
jgi:sarcosine oxidase subunit gamma